MRFKVMRSSTDPFSCAILVPDTNIESGDAGLMSTSLRFNVYCNSKYVQGRLFNQCSCSHLLTRARSDITAAPHDPLQQDGI